MKKNQDEKDFVLKSKDFQDKGEIPSTFTCDGQNISPQLSWENVPEGAQCLVLILDDPDAQAVVGKTFIHWFVKLPPETKELKQGINIKKDLPEAKELTNDFNKKEYGGPCPPDKEHTYHFSLFALNECRLVESAMTSKSFSKKMAKNIIGQTHLTGRYTKKSNK